jgi:hypothetical protein
MWSFGVAWADSFAADVSAAALTGPRLTGTPATGAAAYPVVRSAPVGVPVSAGHTQGAIR